MATLGQAASMAVPAFVGLVSGAIKVAAFGARRKTGNRRIGFVSSGFLILSLKSFVKAWHLSFGPESLAWEIALSVLDLASVMPIAWPLLMAWGRRLA